MVGVRASLVAGLVALLLVPGLLAQTVPTVPGIPQTGPDTPAVGLNTVDVPVFVDDVWSYTEGARTRNIEVPAGWDRAFVRLTIRPAGDPWDRLFSVALGDMEVLHGTTPRTTMTIEKEITEFGALLPSGGTQDVRLYLGTWVGALRADLSLRFFLDEPTAAIAVPADHAVSAALWRWHCTEDFSRTVTFPTEAPASAIVELYTSGHGGEEFWYEVTTSLRQWSVQVDGVQVAHVVAMPYVYALLGFGGSEGNLLHPLMWWTAQRALDAAGVHTGTGEIPAYRTLIVDEDKLGLLTGERTVTIVTSGTRCSWMTSVGFLLDAPAA